MGNGSDAVAANLARLEGALKRLSWVATLRAAPLPKTAAADGNVEGAADYDRLAAAMARLELEHVQLQTEHARLQDSHAALEQQRHALGLRLEAAIARLRVLIPDGDGEQD